MTQSPDDIDVNGIGMRGGVGQKRHKSQHAACLKKAMRTSQCRKGRLKGGNEGDNGY